MIAIWYSSGQWYVKTGAASGASEEACWIGLPNSAVAGYAKLNQSFPQSHGAEQIKIIVQDPPRQ